MFQRPTSGETDEDLLRQEEELLRRGQLRPSATLVKPDKRKTRDTPPHHGTGAGDTTAPRSKFAQDRANKKKKEGIKDQTILTESVHGERKVAVLGRVVERAAALHPPHPSQAHWCPQPSPQGFPAPTKLQNLTSDERVRQSLHGEKRTKRSLYMQHLEREGLAGKMASSNFPRPGFGQSPDPKKPQDANIAALGTSSYIIKGDGVLKDKKEVEEIHQANLSRLSSMTHEERMKEREELLSSLSQEQLAFISSLRKGGGKVAQGLGGRKPKEAVPMEVDIEKENEGEETETKENEETNRDNERVMDEKENGENKKELKKVGIEEETAMDESETEVNRSGMARERGNGADRGGREAQKDPLLDIPIPLEDTRKWLHMDKVEMDKLRWMSSVPPPKPLKDSEGFVARFNFEGDILPYNVDISYRQGLHHHGEEPGRPGYSLDEIFIMIRSQVLQQRHQGLRMLANIFRNAKEGMYDSCTKPPLVHLAVEAGAVLLLRFALDDSSHLLYGEAVRALHHLVASQSDELCLALAQPWTPSAVEPGVSSEVHATDKSRQELDSEEQDLKDHEVIKLDVVRALVRMDTLVRLRYLLETAKPGAETVIHTLGLLTRVARHSLTAAWRLATTPRLLSILIDSFLPHNVSPLLSGQTVASMTSVYGVPLRHALQLVRVLAAKGRQLAALLINTHQVMDRILVYVALEPGEVSLPRQEALMLSQEAYATWSVFLAYGLSKSVEAAVSFYPMFVKQLVFYRDKVSVNEQQENNKFNYDVGAHMIATLGKALEVAATHSLLEARMRLSQGTLVGSDGNMLVLQPPLITWLHLQDLPQLVETCLTKWLTQLARDPHPTFSALRLIGSCCVFLRTYYTKWKDQVSYSHEECISRIENLYNNVISPALGSPVFTKLLSALPAHSSLCSDLLPGTARDPINIGSLGCVTLGGVLVPVIQQSSPLPLLTPFTSFLLTLHTLHPALKHTSTASMLESVEMATYIEKVCASPRNLASQWLTRVETYFLYNTLQLAGICSVGSVMRLLYHESALCILTCVHKGDEHLIRELLTRVVCAPEFTCDLVEMTQGLDDLTLSDYEPLKSPAIIQPALNPFQMTASILHSLASIGSELSTALVTKKEFEASTVLANGISFITNGITIPHTDSPLALDHYWPLTPCMYAFKTRQKPQGEEKSDQSQPEDILTVTRCLQMAYLGLKHRRRTLLTTATTTSLSAWLQHFSLVLMSANDLFLDPGISSYLQGCVFELLSQGGYAKMDFQSPIECFSSSSDWYSRLVDHYLAVSYGDSTFSLFLVICIQQNCPPELRTILWGDKSDALQFLYLTPEQVKRFIPLQQFLEPPEEDEGLITKYRAALGTGSITAKKNQLMHTIAEHHSRLFLAYTNKNS